MQKYQNVPDGLSFTVIFANSPQARKILKAAFGNKEHTE